MQRKLYAVVAAQAVVLSCVLSRYYQLLPVEEARVVVAHDGQTISLAHGGRKLTVIFTEGSIDRPLGKPL